MTGQAPSASGAAPCRADRSEAIAIHLVVKGLRIDVCSGRADRTGQSRKRNQRREDGLHGGHLHLHKRCSRHHCQPSSPRLMLGRFGDERSDLKHRSARKLRRPSREVRSPSSRWIEHPMPATSDGCGGPRRRSAHGGERPAEPPGRGQRWGAQQRLYWSLPFGGRAPPPEGKVARGSRARRGNGGAEDRTPGVARSVRATLLLSSVILGSRQLCPSPHKLRRRCGRTELAYCSKTT